MATKPDGGPAFPRTAGPYIKEEGDCVNESHEGMSMRDYFAAAALPVAGLALTDTPRPEGMSVGQHLAQIAYAIAERMLAERER